MNFSIFFVAAVLGVFLGSGIDPSESNNFTLGSRIPAHDKKIIDMTVYKPTSELFKKNATFKAEKGAKINYVEAKDLLRSNVTVHTISGGIGQNNITLLFDSGLRQEVKYNVAIWARSSGSPGLSSAKYGWKFVLIYLLFIIVVMKHSSICK